MPNLVVRVWLPDRPGALGLVASRIGAIGGDIVGVDVLERSEHVAVDEFAVVLPDDENLTKLLIREIEEVDGASVEECHEVARFPDARIDALESVQRLCEATTPRELAGSLCQSVLDEFGADWAAVLRDDSALSTAGATVPDTSVLHALVTGTTASAVVVAGDSGPDDLAVALVPEQGWALLAGRAGHPFRRRERRQLLALAAIADRIVGMLAN